MKRRRFIRQSGTFIAASSMAMSPSILKAASNISKLDKIRIGVIGCNGMGWSDTHSLLKMSEIELVGICDVDQRVIDRRLTGYALLRENKPKVYTDYRKLLEDKKIDAVVIGTPDHWHCKQMIDAVAAGKHVYVEKPVANTIEESMLMVEAAEKYGKVVQTGQWQRSGPHYKEAVDIVQSGKLGKIRLVKVWAYQGWMKPVPVLPDTEAPEGVDYATWLGPAPMRPFNANRFHFNFRWFWDYAGGLMTDWGVHEIDIALWAMNAVAPVSVMASGGKFAYPNDASETPDTLQTVFEFEDYNMLWEHATGIDLGPYGKREGIAFIGNNGTLVVNRDGYEVLAENNRNGYSSEGTPKIDAMAPVKTPDNVSYLDLHTRNFVEAIKANDPSILNTPIALGSLAAINAQMGNIAYRTGEKLFWDKKLNKFIDNESANSMIKANYRNGWKLPTV